MCQKLQHRGFNVNGRSTGRPYSRYSSRGTPTPFEDSDTTPSRKSSISSGENGNLPQRYQKIHRNFDFFLPKFHFILPNFYFPVPWRIFVSLVAIGQFLRGGCAWSARLPQKKHPHLLCGEGADAICCGVAFVAKPIFRQSYE
mgnify:CR=1 FL=1